MGGFRKFLLRGNLIDLAVAVVIGVAFNAIIQALVADIITPLISAAGGSKTTFASLKFTLGHSQFKYGLVLNAAFAFLVIAAVVYFLLVSPADRLSTRMARNKAATTRECPECLSTIPVGASRCMYCTAVLVEQSAPPAPDVPQPRLGRHGQFAEE